MDPSSFTRIDPTTWQIEPTGAMRVPGIIYAYEGLIRDMDEKVYEQTTNVATLPGIVKAVYGRCQSKILNTWSGHRTAQIDPEKCRKINGREIRF